jgi:hypothetical protein
MPPPERLTFVTVVFGAEQGLLELQARSLARFLPTDLVDSIVVIDNGWRALSPARMRRLRAAYGALSDRLTVVRTAQLVPDLPAAIGWRSQQIAKLMVARSITSRHYVVLDAKNHLIRTARLADFVAEDGRARGGTHPYTQHPLKPQLLAVLAYVGASAEATARALEDFPPTATPFVMDTERTRTLIDAVEAESGRPFAAEFERAKLTEFFLYSGWLQVRGPGIDAVYDGVAIPSPTVWPARRSAGGVDAAIREAGEQDSAFFAVHRSALARGDAAGRDRIARFWADRGLFVDQRAARRHIRHFRSAYVPEMALKKLTERIASARS